MSTLATDDLTELVQGMGQASPGPLFLIDEAGCSHPLNGLAEQVEEADQAEHAFVSPVHLGGGAEGRVIGYAPPSAERRSLSLMSALVALVAGALSDRFAGHAAPFDVPKPFPGDPGQALERACSELGTVCDEERVGEIVLEAAACILRSRRASLHVPRRDGGTLEVLASSGGSERPVRATRLGSGLIGWAATRREPLLLVEGADLPPEAPDCARRELEDGPPYPLPLAIVPLRCGPELAGVLCVGGLPSAAADPERADAALNRLDRTLEKASANLAGLRILRQVRREERVGRELEIAQQIQSGLLPAAEVRAGELELAGDCLAAAQVGGDGFGHELDARGRLQVTLFDVAGHGIGAAVGMTMVRSVILGELARAAHPAAAMKFSNTRLAADLDGSGLYATAFVARFDEDGCRLDYASAGHPPPIHWSATERGIVPRSEGGLPLGLLPGSEFAPAEAEFAAGDVLVMFTDGILEARDPSGRPFGRARLVAGVRRLRRRSAAAIHRGLRSELERFTAGRPLEDDATLVVVKRRRPAPSQSKARATRRRPPNGSRG